jgi:Family of unknown function (DUF5723)
VKVRKLNIVHSARAILLQATGVLACILVCSIYSNAQTPSLWLMGKDSSYKASYSIVMVNGEGFWNSDALNVGFAKKMAFGGHIERDAIDHMIGDMNDQSRVGFNAHAGIEVYGFNDSLFGNSDWGLRARISSNYNAHLNFSRDLFKTVLEGNRSFVGDTAQFGPLIGEFQAYQKFGFGFFSKKNLSSLMLSFVSGQEYQNINMRNSYLYTSANADTMVVGYRGEYSSADNSKHGFGVGKGAGLALDFDLNLPLESGKGFLSLTVSDLGFIAWNKNSNIARMDSSTTWVGYNINNLFALDSNHVVAPNLKDSLHYTTRNRSHMAVLPGSIHVRWMRYFNQKNYVECGVSLWPNRTSIPMAYAAVGQMMGNNFSLIERVSLGGYGGFAVGVEAQWMPKNSWYLKLGTYNALGFVSDNAKGMDLRFALAKVFQKRKNDNTVVQP